MSRAFPRAFVLCLALSLCGGCEEKLAPTQAAPAPSAPAPSAPAPRAIQAANPPSALIDAPWLLANRAGVVVVDSRSPADYAAGHIEGAIHLDLKNLDTAATANTKDVQDEATVAKVTTPDGRSLDYSFDGMTTAFLTETFEAGVYEVEFDKGGTRRLALNIGRDTESLIAPRESLSVEGSTIVTATGDVRVNREVWHWFVLAALGFLMIEWGLYCRRTFM